MPFYGAARLRSFRYAARLMGRLKFKAYFPAAGLFANRALFPRHNPICVPDEEH